MQKAPQGCSIAQYSLFESPGRLTMQPPSHWRGSGESILIRLFIFS